MTPSSDYRRPAWSKRACPETGTSRGHGLRSAEYHGPAEQPRRAPKPDHPPHPGTPNSAADASPGARGSVRGRWMTATATLGAAGYRSASLAASGTIEAQAAPTRRCGGGAGTS